MEVKIDKKKTAATLTVTVPAEELVPYFKKAYDKLAESVKIDGFRPGKAPRNLVEASIGASRLLSEALDLAINDSYFKAVYENKLNVISSPKLVINKYPNYGLDAKEIAQELEFEAEVEFLGEVVFGDYSKVKVEQGKPEQASDEDLEKVLEHFRKQASVFEDKDGVAEKGDHVEITFEGFVKKVRIDAMCSKNHPLILGENTMIPGFEEEILGMKKGEKKEFKIKFPKEYHSKDYAGKDAEFKIELLALKSIKKPEVDDKFAEKFGHKNVADLKKAIKENLNQEYDQEYKHQIEIKVFDAVLPLLEVELPTSLVEKEVERMMADYAQQISSQGIDFDKYLASTKKNKDDLKREMVPVAERNIKIGLILGKIVEEQKLDHNKPESAQQAMDHLVKTVIK